MDYEMFKSGIDVKKFNDELIQRVLYSSDIVSTDDNLSVLLKGGN